VDDEAAVSALERFGLTNYEARVLLALQKLGTGTASEVSDVSEVPRSQVYGAAEGLVGRGLLEVQPTNPRGYRPGDVARVRERLLRELRAEGKRAFEYLESVRGTHAEEERRTGAVWTVEGQDPVAARVAELVEDADDRLAYGTRDVERLEPVVVDALEAAAADGVEVIVSSADPAVYGAFAELTGVSAHRIPEEAAAPDIATGRILTVDRDGVLISAVESEYYPDAGQETAVWSVGTAFAAVFVALFEEWIDTHLR
jgi:sugar-specific transcriptional regulator TrmB